MTERHIFEERRTAKTQAEYNSLFGDIVMSFVVIAEEGTPTTSHYGIFRNPLDFLDPEEKYKRTSMVPHGFAAEIASRYFHEKHYMVTNPLSSMAAIFTRALKPGEMFLGTNEDLKKISRKSVRDVMLLQKYPPIWHEDPSTHVTKIAREGTDISHHLDTLPEELTQFTAKEGQVFDRSGMTEALRTVVKLTSLALRFNQGGG